MGNARALSFRTVRLDLLRQAQNADGGWGYKAGGQSWLEPTCLAMLALTGADAAPALEKGWKLLQQWQLPDGGYRPAAMVAEPCWATSLCVTLQCVHKVFDSGFDKGVAWLLGSRGIEGSPLERALHLVGRMVVEYNPNLKGWPWSPESTSWVEPTAHALVALKKVRQVRAAQTGLAERIEEGERMLADRRCRDGGWNYGNRRVLRTDLPSYPETTALALLGLQGATVLPLDRSLTTASRQWQHTVSRMGKAWLAIAMRPHGRTLELPELAPPADLCVVALEALAMAEGDKRWLEIG